MPGIRTASRARRIGAAMALAVVATLLTAAPASAAVTVVAVTVTPARADLATGFADVTLDIALQSTEPLGDVIGPSMFGETATTVAEPLAERGPASGSEILPTLLWWEDLTRVSGTPTDGVWRGTVRLSRWWSGTWVVTRLDGFAGTQRLEAGAVRLRGDAPPRRRRGAALGGDRRTARRGAGRHRDRAVDPTVPRHAPSDRLGDRGRGRPRGLPVRRHPAEAAAPTTYPVGRADRAGYVTGQPQSVAANEQIPLSIPVYAGRGSRGFSWEARRALRRTSSGRPTSASAPRGAP